MLEPFSPQSESAIRSSFSNPPTASVTNIKRNRKNIVPIPEDQDKMNTKSILSHTDAKGERRSSITKLMHCKTETMGHCGDRKNSLVNISTPTPFDKGSESDSDSEKSIKEVKGYFEALPLLKQRLGYMWERKMHTDVVFKLGVDEFPIEAHRTILASASELFQELLFGSKPLITDEKFVLYEKEFSVPAFQAFIKAFYTNEIPISLTLSMALEVFYATKKYRVGFLQDQVLNHIRTAVSVSNVFEALRVSTNMIELTFIVPICWNIIEEQTAEVLEYHLETMDSHTLTRVLERDRLNLEEFELFQYLVKWGAIVCKQKGMKTTAKNKRQFIEPLLKYIRFTTMTNSEINDSVVPSRVMEPRETQAILTYVNKSEPKLPVPYKTQVRLRPSSSLGQKFEKKLKGKDSQRFKMSSVSDSIVVTRMTESAKISTKRINGKKQRSKRSSAQTTPRL